MSSWLGNLDKDKDSTLVASDESSNRSLSGLIYEFLNVFLFIFRVTKVPGHSWNQ